MMNKLIINLFSNGINNGNTTIISKDGKKIKFHSFIIKKQSEFFKVFFNLLENKKKICELDNQKFNIINIDLEPNEIIMYIKLLDELQVN